MHFCCLSVDLKVNQGGRRKEDPIIRTKKIYYIYENMILIYGNNVY